MTKFKVIVIIVKCVECGNEHSHFVPLVINEEDWRKTKEIHGEMVTEKI